MNLYEIGILIAILGVITPFCTDSYLLWFHKKEIKDLADYDECKKNGIDPAEILKYANNLRRWNRASVFLIAIGLLLMVLNMVFGA